MKAASVHSCTRGFRGSNGSVARLRFNQRRLQACLNRKDHNLLVHLDGRIAFLQNWQSTTNKGRGPFVLD